MRSVGERLIDRVLALSAAVTRRGMMPLRLLSLGAILFCLVGAWSVVHDPISTSTARAGALISTGGSGNSTQVQTADEVSGAQPTARVPQHFATMSISRVASTIFALGEGVCTGQTPSLCPALVCSTDSGRTWQQIHAFPSADSTALGGGSEPLIQPARALSHVVFTSKRVGYVFGSDLWVTKDGGKSFLRINHRGLSVLGVKEWEGKPVILTADGCIQGLCTGRIGLSRLTSDGNALAAPLATVSSAAPYAGAAFATSGSELVLVATGSAGSGDEPGSWGLMRTGLTRISPPSSCNGTSFAAVSGRSDGQGFVALCNAAVSPAMTTYTSMTSRDGLTWDSTGSGNLVLPTQGQISLATFDGVHLVAASGGPRSGPDGTTRASRGCPLAITADSGKSWRIPKQCGKAPVGGMDAVEAWGANEFVSLTGTTSDYWHTRGTNDVWIRTKIPDRGD